MATRTTYLLISRLDDEDELEGAPLLSEHDFEQRKTYRLSSEDWCTVKYAIEHPLDDAVDFTEGAQALSSKLPQATVLLCEVEERFDQIDAVRTMTFVNGRNAGKIEHGHIFNVGGR